MPQPGHAKGLINVAGRAEAERRSHGGTRQWEHAEAIQPERPSGLAVLPCSIADVLWISESPMAGVACPRTRETGWGRTARRRSTQAGKGVDAASPRPSMGGKNSPRDVGMERAAAVVRDLDVRTDLRRGTGCAGGEVSFGSWRESGHRHDGRRVDAAVRKGSDCQRRRGSSELAEA